MSYVNQRQDGNTNLFWHQFVGQDAQNQFITGRAGWTHMPPNTTTNYDYLNPVSVPSDIEDWRPDASGSKKPVNVNTWGSLTYPWPGAPDFGQRVETQWYVYWMQNLPGRANEIRHGANWLTNWWAFVGDWDAAITSGLGLYGASQASAARPASQYPYDAPRAGFTRRLKYPFRDCANHNATTGIATAGPRTASPPTRRGLPSADPTA